MSFPVEKKLYFIAVGDAAANIAKKLMKQGVEAGFMFIGSRMDASAGVVNIKIDTPRMEVFPGSKKFMLADLSVDAHLPLSVTDILKENNHFVVVSCLGGYVGTMFTAKIMRFLQKHGKDYSIIASLPFRFEGRSRAYNASVVVRQLTGNSNATVFNLDDLNEEYDLYLREAFDVADWKFMKIINDKFNLKMTIKFPALKPISPKVHIRRRKLLALPQELSYE